MNTDFKTATLTKHTQLTYDVFELAFEAEETDFLHEAGQFITIKVPQENAPGAPGAPEAPNASALPGAPGTPKAPLLMRSYSISSHPKQGCFELCIKQVENGRGSTYLNSLQPGEKISFLGPLGHFTFRTQPSKRVLFVATGTGIASIKSIIEDQLERRLHQPQNTNADTATNARTAAPRQFQLLFGVRHIKDIFYKAELDTLAEKYTNFKYTLTLSQPESPDWEAQGGKIGRVTAHLEKLDFGPGKDLDPASTDAYVCGLKDMVFQVTEMLQQKGLPKEAVYFERFN